MRESIKALKLGIEAEKQGLITYLGFARKTKDLTGKNMFIRLAMDEFDHMNTLEKQLESLLENRCWVKVAITKSEIEELIPKLKERDRETKGKSGAGELSALNTALDLEKKAIDFYKERQEKEKDPEAIAMYKRLVEMETSHYDIIQTEIDYIKGTGVWFGIPEFSSEEKP